MDLGEIEWGGVQINSSGSCKHSNEPVGTFLIS
jgi:hypothetical protein